MNKKSKKPDETETTEEDISSNQTVMPSPVAPTHTDIAKNDAGVPEPTVIEHSFKTKNRLGFNGHNPSNIRGPGPMHRAADTLHGWSDYQHHYNKPMRLSESDYLAAIKAAGNYETHPAAIAPHRK